MPTNTRADTGRDTRRQNGGETGRDATFIRRVVIVIALGALAAATWKLADILLLIFGSVLVAVMLRAMAQPMTRYLHFSPKVALAVAVLVIVGAFVVAVVWLGPEFVNQMRGLQESLPKALSRLSEVLKLGSITDLMKDSGAASTLGSMVTRLFTWSTTLLGALASVALVSVGGIYFAADPALYRDGLVKLFPPAIHANVQATLDDAGDALKLWLGGQLFAMLTVGVMAAVGLYFAGVPSAIALGLLFGLADFVPYVGPILASVPVILLASTQDLQTVAYALVVIVVVQQIEGNLVVPLIAGRMVSVAPVVGLFAVVAMGILFGPLGLLFGFPLTVVADIAVRRLYVMDALGEPVEILGEQAEPSKP